MDVSRGLNGSRWAPHNISTSREAGNRRGGSSPTRKSQFTQGHTLDIDWDCTSCGFSNFGWRKECFRCQHAKGDGSTTSQRVKGFNENIAPAGENGIQSSGWPTLPNGNGRATAQPPIPINDDPTIAPRGALAMSRWAPRNRQASEKYGDRPWIRTIPIPSPSRPQTPPDLDLGLPYEVQHYILAMMQRILEEACFDLASRWIPSILLSRGWSCSEAVELSAWKRFLPTAIPYNAITPVMSYSLEMGLSDAVRIRNLAVHRHLCDNRELRTLALKAGNLMEMFGDASRREKFERLRVELTRWDEGCRGDRDVARGVLEEALKGIGERPVDDMDWTPNMVSMQEIKGGEGVDGSGEVSGQINGEGQGEYGDEMELD